MRSLTVLPFLCAFVAFTPMVAALKLLQSTSLTPCLETTNFSASLFNVRFTPDNSSLYLDINAYSAISGNVTAELQVIAYGFTALTQTVDPCKDTSGKFASLCPMSAGPLDFSPTVSIGEDVIKQIPSIAYNVPDLDGQIKIIIHSKDTNDTIACLEANLSNAQTVYQKGVEWAVAVIAGLGLVASAITSGLGHSNTAAHVAANALSLFGFFQAQAMIGATSIHMPPIVESWTQNFQWSIGIIHVTFIETIATWYQRATGGTPSTLLDTITTTSILVEKRWLQDGFDMFRRGMNYLAEREQTSVSKTKIETISGLTRVAFKGGMEVTNIFLTGLIWFSVFVTLVILGVSAFKGITELLVKHGKMSGDKFQDFRNGWKVVLRGILFRLILIGWAQMCVLCLWEFTVHDSAAEIILAIIMFFSMLGVLGWASFKVIQLARRSIAMHKNPAYILYSDPNCLNKWGFLYVQYKATSYYFVIPWLAYLLIKGMFIAFAQNHAVVQAVALLIIEAAFLVAASVIRPWMDKKTNIFNISIAAINFLNSIFLLVFSNVFNQPGMVSGVMGVVFFVINCIFAFVLLVLVLIASIYAMVSKNPDMRYQPMRDDRASFIKSNTELNTELDALANTARGGEMELKSTAYHPTYEDESNSFSSGNGASISNHNQHDGNRPPRSPVDPSVPLFPSSHGPPPSYDSNGYNDNFNPSAALAAHNFRQQNNSSPWQRGAGYDH